MLFQILTIFALLLMLLTGTAAFKCENGTASWPDLGDDHAIYTAFKEFCSGLDSTCDVDCTFVTCIDVGENHINAMITVDKKTEDLGGLCEGSLYVVEAACPHGGSDSFKVVDDGIFIQANITGHPRHNKCKSSA